MDGPVAFRYDERAFKAVVLALKISLCAMDGLLKRAGIRAARVCTGVVGGGGSSTIDLVSSTFDSVRF